jgi:membrane-bound lytic murein transglycosylase A
MNLDRRYVFFHLQLDDGGAPAGAAGVRLIPGRTLAVDPASHRMGEILWIDAASPTLPGAFASYRRVAVALDTGSAIKGDARADLYVGEGDAAGLEAGRVRHALRLYRLDPIGPPAP